jgi:hypothetical protein
MDHAGERPRGRRGRPRRSVSCRDHLLHRRPLHPRCCGGVRTRGPEVAAKDRTTDHRARPRPVRTTNRLRARVEAVAGLPRRSPDRAEDRSAYERDPTRKDPPLERPPCAPRLGQAAARSHQRSPGKPCGPCPDGESRQSWLVTPPRTLLIPGHPQHLWLSREDRLWCRGRATERRLDRGSRSW